MNQLLFMFLSDFDYELPDELIAQQPLARRDASRMLVVEKRRASFRDARFVDLPAELQAGDCIVVNNTKVFPARLIGRREPSGGHVELFLLRPHSLNGDHIWEVLARPARRLQRGARIVFDERISSVESPRIEIVDEHSAFENVSRASCLRGEVLEILENGQRVVRFECDVDFDSLVDRLGRTPLPPYIKRAPDEPLETTQDRARYQTVFAARRGAIAAPTAGLHFTSQIFAELEARGVRGVEITLHVGYGTFEPVRVEDLRAHKVAAEHYEVSDDAAKTLNDSRAGGGRIIAVGTTTTRALESSIDERGHTKANSGTTDLTITSGYEFRAVDALLTNFHLPRSSLFVLVAAFAGHDLTLRAYRHAVAARYRFYSYGDCMLII